MRLLLFTPGSDLCLNCACLTLQELGLVITGTLPVFNKTGIGSKVSRTTVGLLCYHFFKNHLNHSRLLLFCALTYSFCVLLHPSLLHLTHKINVLYARHFDPMRGFKSVVFGYSIKFTRPKSKHTITVSSFTFILCSLVALTYILC